MADAEKEMKNGAGQVADAEGVVVSAPQRHRGTPIDACLDEMEDNTRIVEAEIEHGRTSRLRLRLFRKTKPPEK